MLAASHGALAQMGAGWDRVGKVTARAQARHRHQARQSVSTASVVAYTTSPLGAPTSRTYVRTCAAH